MHRILHFIFKWSSTLYKLTTNTLNTQSIYETINASKGSYVNGFGYPALCIIPAASLSP